MSLFILLKKSSNIFNNKKSTVYIESYLKILTKCHIDSVKFSKKYNYKEYKFQGGLFYENTWSWHGRIRIYR